MHGKVRKEVQISMASIHIISHEVLPHLFSIATLNYHKCQGVYVDGVSITLAW